MTNIFKNRGNSYYFYEERTILGFILLLPTKRHFFMIRKKMSVYTSSVASKHFGQLSLNSTNGCFWKTNPTSDRNLIFLFHDDVCLKDPIACQILLTFEFSIYSIISLWIINKSTLILEVREQQLHVEDFNHTKMSSRKIISVVGL